MVLASTFQHNGSRFGRHSASAQTRLARFVADEDGGITVDWLALTASVVGVVLLGVTVVGQHAVGASTEIGAALRAADLGEVTVVAIPSGSGLAKPVGAVESLTPWRELPRLSGSYAETKGSHFQQAHLSPTSRN